MRDYGEEVTAFVAARLREARLDNGLSLADVAARADVHRTTVHLVERGQRGITLAVAARVARALDLRLSTLVADAERAAGKGR